MKMLKKSKLAWSSDSASIHLNWINDCPILSRRTAYTIPSTSSTTTPFRNHHCRRCSLLPYRNVALRRHLEVLIPFSDPVIHRRR